MSKRAVLAESTIPLTAAERMRQSRKRRRNGLHCLQVLLHETEIDGLVAKGHLRSEQRGNRKAVKDALDGFVIRELGLPEQES